MVQKPAESERYVYHGFESSKLHGIHRASGELEGSKA